MKVLILENEMKRIRVFKEWFEDKFDLTVCMNAFTGESAVRSDKFDVIFLDHDLGKDGEEMESEERNTGYQVSKVIMENVDTSTPIIIHSMNAVGAENMAQLLGAAGFKVVKVPFGSMRENIIS